MPSAPSLDELIARKAVEFADQVKKAAALADKEEEIRIEVEKQLAFIQKEAGIELHGKHEFTVARGRIDSVYSRVLIEYKNPSDSGARIGPRADSPGCKKVVEQIKSRFRGLKDEQGHPLTSLFGVGLDGKHFIFVRFRDGAWQVQESTEVTRHSSERLLWALFNLGQKGKPFSPEYLAGDFGANETSIAVRTPTRPTVSPYQANRGPSVPPMCMSNSASKPFSLASPRRLSRRRRSTVMGRLASQKTNAL